MVKLHACLWRGRQRVRLVVQAAVFEVAPVARLRAALGAVRKTVLTARLTFEHGKIFRLFANKNEYF